MDKVEITQKKSSHEISFTFEEEFVNLAYKDKDGSSDVDIDYSTIPNKTGERIIRNEWLRNVGYLWTLIGFFQIGSALYSGGSLSGTGFWLLLGLICLVWYRRSQVHFTVMDCDYGRILIIQNQQHDRIVGELQLRRKQRLLSLYGEIDSENDPAREIEKFRWLEAQGVLSSDEAEIKIAQVERDGLEGRSDGDVLN